MHAQRQLSNSAQLGGHLREGLSNRYYWKIVSELTLEAVSKQRFTAIRIMNVPSMPIIGWGAPRDKL